MSTEFERHPHSGWTALAVLVLATLGDAALFVFRVVHIAQIPHGDVQPMDVITVVAPVLLFVVILVFWAGLFTLQPNEAAVMLLFGQYKGTVRSPGFNY